MNRYLLSLSSAIVVCALMAGCGGPSSAVSSTAAPSSVAAVSAASDSSEAQQSSTSAGKELTTNTSVSGALQPVKSDVLSGYDHYSTFQNGWAFALKGDQAGYVSETGEFKPLYTISIDDLYQKNLFWISPEPTQPIKYDIDYFTENFGYGESGLVPYYKDGKWGYSDLDGNIVVSPIYEYVTAFDKLGFAEYRGDLPEDDAASDATSTTSASQGNFIISDSNQGPRTIYYVFDKEGNKIAEGYKAWIDGDNGYYIAGTKEDPSATCLYNMDGTLMLNNVTVEWRNRPYAEMDFYPGGIVLAPDQTFAPDVTVPQGSVVLVDRTGKQTTIQTDKDIRYLTENSEPCYIDDDGIAILDSSGNLLVNPSINLLGDLREDGNRFIRSYPTKKLRLYDAQYNEVSCIPALTFVKATDSDNYSVNIVDQDYNTLLTLTGTPDDMWGPNGIGIYDSSDICTENDWFFWCPDNTTAELYHVELAK